MKYLKKNKRYIYLEYGVLALLIMWPLLAKGYVFAMDMAWPVQFTFPDQISNFYPIQILLWLINFVIPSWLMQKFVIFFTFFFAGLFAHKLIRTKYQWPKYFAGLLYVLTPYLYSKFLYGQIWLCLAYALLPLLLRYLWNLFDEPNWKYLFKCLAVFCLIGFVGLHFAFISALIVVLAILVHLITLLIKKDYTRFKIVFKFIVTLFVLFFVINSFWIFIFASGDNMASQKMQLFDNNQMEIFKTDNGGTNVFFNVLSMYGFWGDRHNLYILPKQFISFWWILSIAFMSLSILGFISSFVKKERRESAVFSGLLILIGTILSVGITSETLRPFIMWMNNYVPFYQGFREPQKFTALIVLGYCLLCSTGLIYLSEKLVKRNKENYIAMALLLVILYNPLMFNGLRGQMFVSNYPDSWAEVKQILDSDKSEIKILVLPWHLYMSYDFTRNKIVGPLACAYFDKTKTICGDNMELENTYALTSRSISIYLNKLILQLEEYRNDFSKQIELYDIHYIVILKEVDWEKYNNFIKKQTSCKEVFNSNEIILYKSQHK
ncbi:MAG: hypothetical protein UT32_C0009G0067 [Parcubacteria group bacterium GW2011_GWC2_39_14]|nr:MAG: hypothetical protein UT32_C0009G0067 [Parcubacteria group bacterium GW2011_GWC2_39_14]KKR55405.1 MAG: hypothetical protein UT91_C0002G0066 [Parcubacteria group bacterium GW2011_GWA2_40_23]